MSLYSVHEVTTREELDGVIDVVWKAWWDPYLPVQRIIYPLLGNTEEDLAGSIAASKERIWTENVRIWTENVKQQQTGNKRWVYARHTGGTIVGGVQLDFASGSPFANGCPQLNLYWWPEGSEIKAFCEEMIAQAFTARCIFMQRPHRGKPAAR